MKSSTLSITFAAVIMAAAFAGVMLIADDASAGTITDGGDETSSIETITYIGEKQQTTKTIDEGATTFEVPSPAGLGFSDENFLYWTNGEGNVFQPGETRLISVLVADKDSTNATLTAVYDDNIYITIDVGDESYKCLVTNDALDGTTDAYKALVEAVLALDGRFEFSTLYDMDGKKAGSITIGDSNVIVSVTNCSKSAELILELTPIYKCTFVHEDGKSAGDPCYTNAFKQPADPEVDHYIFKGWAVDGEIVSITVLGKIIIPEEVYKNLSGDTEFVAVFEPEQLYITLMVDGKQYGDPQSVKYNEIRQAYAYPEGYICWSTMEVVEGKEVYTPFDFTQPVTESVTLYAQKAEEVFTLSFESEGNIIGGPYVAAKGQYTIPSNPVVEGKKFVGWFDGTTLVQDIDAYVASHPGQNIKLVANFTNPDAPAGPGFFKTTTGQCAAVLIAVAVIAFIYAVYSNMFGMKDFLTSFKVQRVKKV